MKSSILYRDKMLSAQFPAVFIIPFYCASEIKVIELKKTLESIFCQTDKKFKVVIINDCSPYMDTSNSLLRMQEKYLDKIHIITNEKNMGPGESRNRGIRWAYENESPFVLFTDHDDISHPRRLEVTRNIFSNDPEVSVVYSPYYIIDENDQVVPRDKITPTIREILESHDHDPVQGYHAWVRIGTETGYTNCSSATSVLTELAVNYPFPPVRVSEDSHTWMRYSAGGNKFYFTAEIPSQVRVPQNSDGSSSRSMAGGRHLFNIKKVETDTDGFLESLAIAVKRGTIKEDDQNSLLIKFYIKLAQTMLKENEYDLVSNIIEKAIAVSKKDTLGIFKIKELSLHS